MASRSVERPWRRKIAVSESGALVRSVAARYNLDEGLLRAARGDLGAWTTIGAKN